MVFREENLREVKEGRSLSETSGERTRIGRDQEGDRPSPMEGATAQSMNIENLSAFYGSFKAVTDVNMEIMANKVTAMNGPSGCGKSTFIRCLNRLHEVIPTAHAKGCVKLGEQDIYGKGVDPVRIRRRIGMVFQKPNPFSKTIYENVAWGARINGYKGDMDELVERSL